MNRWLWVAILAAAAGCNSVDSQQTYERMLLPLMTDVQRADYYKRPTWAERKAYLYEVNLIQRLESAPEPIRKAIRAQRVVRGMTPEQVVMSWGLPAQRFVLPPHENPDVAAQEGRKERWLYGPEVTTDFQIRYTRAIEFTNDVVLHVRDDPRKRRKG